ncbi:MULTISPECIES: guanine deaminase [Halocynthiibacter]|uniref:Guanine deaminase n=1 Tax=Halocynthiibacter halioticoli TaxID=2986804 RepID=A0AAE3IXE5_9RHOB|nr:MULTISPECIES: guanine deaminase [Halocynthiibacter]MCV6823764.1 guanine deaminase [Halocynthiibacter halioticoli]MCW4056765.1 guanine deaminase [Halocynthiibacter sp. SDUM655004]
MELLRGQVLWFDGSPMNGNIEAAARHITHGAIAIDSGRILAVGEADTLAAQYPHAESFDYKDHLLTAGFVDAHVHYPQTAIIASWGKRLIDWLNTYTFPEEMRFGDADYAAEIAARYLDLALANGTTTVASYCTIHPESVDAIFEAAEARQMRIVAGKTCMDRNAPAGLCDTPQSAYDDSKRLLEKWHGKGRAHYAITPRFSPTSTPEQLEALGALWGEHPEVLMQTHLSEQVDEIAWVKTLFPDARDYLDTYEYFGLLKSGGLYGHAIHLEEREKSRLLEMDASLIHCPTSNTFIGSGLFDMKGLAADGHRIGLATDTGGGSNFSMLRTMAAAYEVGQLNGSPLHAAELYWLATAGSAKALHLDDKIGNIAPGMEADIIALDLASTPAIAQRSARAEDIWESLFATIMMGDDRAISDVWVSGQRRALT